MGDKGLRAISGRVDIPLADLHHRYIPRVTPLHLYPGKDPMLFTESHHVSQLRLIIEHGFNWDKIALHPYFLERQHRFIIGVTRWNVYKLIKHINKRWKTFQSLKKYGYDKVIQLI